MGLFAAIKKMREDQQNKIWYERGAALYSDEKYAEAVECFRRAAENGHAESMSMYADCLLGGMGIEENIPQAVAWYKQAAEKGHAPSMYMYALCLYHGEDISEGIEQDLSQAVKWYKQAAQLGNCDANLELGKLYKRGEGVQRDPEKAVACFQKAMEEEEEAMVEYAVCLYEGIGIAKDEKKAYELARKAFRRKNDDGYAAYMIGYCFEHGRGVERDIFEARTWYKQAADLGESNGEKAYEQLQQKAQQAADEALRIEEGRVEGKVPGEALEAYLRAAELENAFAQYRAGEWYKNGTHGTPVDLEKALYYLGKAKQNGHRQARDLWAVVYMDLLVEHKQYKQLAFEYLSGEFVPTNIKKMLEYLVPAAKTALSIVVPPYTPPAKDGSGILLYEKGRKCERDGDFRGAMELYRAAAKLKNPDAIYRYGELGYWTCDKDTENYKKLAVEMRHPLAVDNWASIAEMAKEGDVDAMIKLCYCSRCNDPSFKELMQAATAEMMARRAEFGSVEDVFYLSEGWHENLCDRTRYNWKKHLPKLADYGKWLYNQASDRAYGDWDTQQDAAAYAKKALSCGILRAEDVLYDIQRTRDYLAKQREQQRKIEREIQRVQLAEFERELDQKERMFNLAFNGHYSTEREAFLNGRRSVGDAITYESHRQDLIDEFKKKQ